MESNTCRTCCKYKELDKSRESIKYRKSNTCRTCAKYKELEKSRNYTKYRELKDVPELL